MENKVEKALDGFLETLESEDEKNLKIETKNVKKVILDEREGLIERIDRVLVTKDGKQLLREQY
jgi:flagellar basal body P-ring protein FlgI